MKKLLVSSLIAGALLSGATAVNAAEVKGDVKSDVKAGVILQKNTGIANKTKRTSVL